MPGIRIQWSGDRRQEKEKTCALLKPKTLFPCKNNQETDVIARGEIRNESSREARSNKFPSPACGRGVRGEGLFGVKIQKPEKSHRMQRNPNSLIPDICHRSSNQRGIALIIVLWTTVLLALIAGGFALAMRDEAMAAQNSVSAAQARWIADGAVNRAIFELVVPRVDQDAAWRPDGRTYSWEEDGAVVEIKAVDEGAFIDLNTANDKLLQGLFEIIGGGLDEMEASRMVDVIVDWRDVDDMRRPNGAEARDYRAAKLDYEPPNAPFQSVEELGMVLGMTASLYEAVAPHLTVYSRQQGVNTETASREVLLCIPGATDAAVDDFLARRAEALANRLPVPSFMGGGGRSSVWRIIAEVEMEDGVRFTRIAVLRYTGQVKMPLSVMLWSEG